MQRNGSEDGGRWGMGTKPDRHEASGQERLLLSAQEAARVLGISERTLWTMKERDAVPHVNIGRRVLYPRGELTGWIGAGCPENWRKA